MSDKPKLTVVEMFPDSKPLIGSLIDRIQKTIDDFVEETDLVTYAEIVGCLELVKQKIIFRWENK